MATRPPLNALHVFCTVVREGGFRQAALGLHVTPGAVSRQIQALEEQLSQVLFERGAGAHSVLTPVGRLLYERVADKMAGIVAVLESGVSSRHSTIVVETGVTLAMHWLIPQLRAFTERRPTIQVQVRTIDGDIDPTSPVDVFIRRDRSELRGLPCETFMIERSLLVAGHSLLPAAPARTGDDMRWLQKLPRIGARSRPDLWPQWNEAHGLSADALEPTVVFDNTVLAIQAAAQGLGACVVPEAFVDAMLDSGTLKQLHARCIETGRYQFAVGRRRASARVAAFTDWLREISAGHGNAGP